MSNVDSNSTPLPPTQDPFYSAPENFTLASPGTVLRSRIAPGNLTTVYNVSSIAYNILYRTTDSLYKPSWAVTTVLVPSNRTSTKSLLSYQIPYNTADVDHSPSYGLHYELSLGLVQTDINTALSYGWYVNVPDFEGPSASFGLGVQEGHAVIDSIRAVLASNSSLGLSQNDTKIALWGYSGGSIASEWAAELQIQYAPELNISGVALGGVVPNVTSTISSIDGTPGAGLIPPLLISITNQDPEAYSDLVDSLKTSGPYNDTGFLATKNYSYFQSFAAYLNQSVIADYFVDGASVLEIPAVRRVLDNNAYMGYHGVPSMPMYVYKAVHDEYSVVEDTDALIARFCGIGANILYQRNVVGNHIDEETNGDQDAIDWLQSVFDGTLNQQGCTIQNVTIAVSVHGPFESPAQNSG